MRVMKPIVAEMLPNIYSAANRANLMPEEQNQIEQMSWTVKKNKQLSQMSKEGARAEYERLDPNVQEGLKHFFGETDYMKEPPDFSDKFLGVLKTTAKGLASPLLGLLKVAGAYNRVINMPYVVGRQVAQGEGIFDYQVWKDGWDGHDLYDNGALKEAVDRFGKEKIYIAKGLLEGRKPGEILEEYGKITPEIAKAMEEAFNDPDSFKQVLDAAKYAQISPGRDIARFFDTKPPKNGSLSADYIDGTTKGVSGAIDFIYQLAVDPLTWMTGGTSKAALLGTRLSTKVLNAGPDVAGGVREVFKNKSVIKLWDEQFGPEVKRLADAKGTAEKSIIRREIGQNFPGYNNDEALDFFVKNKMFTAPAAEEVFAQADNVHYLLSGRLDGIVYRRNGVVTARNARRFRQGYISRLDAFANSKRSAKEIDKPGEDIMKELTKTGKESDLAVNPNLEEAFAAENDINKLRFKIGRMMARTPGGQRILTGKDAIKTIETFRNYARLTMNRDMADFVAQKFLQSTEAEQIVIIRNVYGTIMQRAGITDKRIIEEYLKKTHNGRAGFTTTAKQEIDPAFASVLADDVYDVVNDVPIATGASGIHASQLAGAVGPLPLAEIAIKAHEIKTKGSLITAAGGALESKFVKNYVDFWSVATLFPRLGIRSAVDESIMHLLTAPSKDIFGFIRGKRAGRSATRYTGQKGSETYITNKLRKLFGKEKLSEFLSLEKRNELILKLAKEDGVSPAELDHLRINNEILSRLSIFTKDMKPDDLKHWEDLMLSNPDGLRSMADSTAARTSGSGQIDEVFTNEQINVSNLTFALNKIGKEATKKGNKEGKRFKKGSQWNELDVAKLIAANPKYLTLAHYDNWYIRFAAPTNHGKNYGVYSAPAFFNNNGLRTPEDLTAAIKDMLADFNIYRVDTGLVVKTGGEPKLAEFVNMFADTVLQRERGKTDAEIANIYIQRMLIDMRDNFHGGPKLFNEALFDGVRANFVALKKKAKEDGTELQDGWLKASQMIDYDQFEGMTKGFQPTGLINTSIEFPDFTDLESTWARLGDTLMEEMDKQVNAILRQPAVMVAYLNLRKSHTGIEQAKIQQAITREINANLPSRYKSPEAYAKMEERITGQVVKEHTELLLEQAVDTVLKFVDNPSIRSNFAVSVRTVGRFYRATEDFWRRIYRMKDVAPTTLYRLRLMHLGLTSSGMWHEDANGEPYIMMPMDNIIFKMTDASLRALTGKSQYSQPLFNNFTFKLQNMNPSFSPDSGLPLLSGPIGALGVIGIKNFISTVPIPGAERTAQDIDNFALGTMGDNMDLTRALMPGSLSKLWSILGPNEKTRQEVTAAQQAVAYNAANGIMLDPSATDAEKYAYLKNIRISAHNVIALRSILGLISPFTPTIQESQGVPDYLLDTGITSLRNEFFDIQQAITTKFGDDIQDPYEMALSIFIGKNPGKIVYTVSRDEKTTNVIVDKTLQMRNWALNNKSFIGKYGQAGYIFGPHTGDFNAGVYNWLQAADLLKDKSLETYYDDILVAEDKQKYYDIASWETRTLSTETSISERKKIIQMATDARQGLKTSNPLLNAALTGGGNEIATEENILGSIEQIVADADAPISDGLRMKMKTATKAMRDFITFSISIRNKGLHNAAELKSDYRDRVEKIIADLGTEDPAIKEAARAAFNSILKYYSRDTYKAAP
jgi:hypothetical protein